MQVPRLMKISINSGVGMATQDPKILDVTVKELEAITGQKVAITKSKKAISNFKLRENLAIGCRVTFRRAMMYEFVDRLISIALPVCVTSAVSPTSRSTGMATTLSASRNRLCSPRWMPTR